MSSSSRADDIRSSDQAKMELDLASKILRTLSEQEMSVLLNKGGERNYHSNSLIQQGTSSASTSYYIKNGLLKLYTHDEYGTEVVLLIFGTGEFIINAIAEFNGYQTLHIACLTDASLIPLDKQILQEILTTNAKFLFNLLRCQNENFLIASERFRKDQSEAINKILSTIVYMASKWSADQKNIDFIAKIGHQQCAVIANVARETFSRVLGKLKDKKYIVSDINGNMILADKAFQHVRETYSD